MTEQAKLTLGVAAIGFFGAVAGSISVPAYQHYVLQSEQNTIEQTEFRYDALSQALDTTSEETAEMLFLRMLLADFSLAAVIDISDIEELAALDSPEICLNSVSDYCKARLIKGINLKRTLIGIEPADEALLYKFLQKPFEVFGEFIENPNATSDRHINRSKYGNLLLDPIMEPVVIIEDTCEPIVNIKGESEPEVKVDDDDIEAIEGAKTNSSN